MSASGGGAPAPRRPAARCHRRGGREQREVCCPGGASGL